MDYNWVYARTYPDTSAAKFVCQQMGFKYDNLLDQGIDYLSRKIEEEIDKYVAT
jgi:hypothetical protein